MSRHLFTFLTGERQVVLRAEMRLGKETDKQKRKMEPNYLSSDYLEQCAEKLAVIQL